MCLRMTLQVSKIKVCLQCLMGMVVGRPPSGALIIIQKYQESIKISFRYRLVLL